MALRDRTHRLATKKKARKVPIPTKKELIEQQRTERINKRLRQLKGGKVKDILEKIKYPTETNLN